MNIRVEGRKAPPIRTDGDACAARKLPRDCRPDGEWFDCRAESAIA